MSFEEDFSSQYLPVLALMLKCSQKKKKFVGNLLVACSSTCLWMDVTAEVYSTQITGFLFPRYKGMLKANFQNTWWSCAPDTLQCLFHGLHFSTSGAPGLCLKEAPEAVRALHCFKGTGGSGAWHRHSFPLPAPGARASQNLYLSLNWIKNIPTCT